MAKIIALPKFTFITTSATIIVKNFIPKTSLKV